MPSGDPTLNGRFFTGRIDFTAGDFNTIIINYTFFQDPTDNCTSTATRQ